MIKKSIPLASIMCFASFNAFATPSVSGNTISWPAGDWYQVQNANTYASICEGGTSCNVSPGTYIVINHTTGERWTDIEVTDNEGAVNDVTVSGGTISWPNDGWYQVQDATSYENVCEGGTSCDVSPGTYNVINHTTGERWNDIEVGDGGGDTGGDEEVVVFRENFNSGTLDTNVWEAPSWVDSMPQRNFVNDRDQCTVKGTTPSQGYLELEASVVDGSTRSCYLASYDRFGPGPDKIMKVEYRVNLSELKAYGAWFAGWLSPLDVVGSDPVIRLAADEDSSTGHEIDVLEYVPFRKADSTFDTTNWVHPAIHDSKTSDPRFSATGNKAGGAATDDGYFNAGSALLGNIDVRTDNYHVYSVEWDGSCHVFSVDGVPYWTNKTAARSTAENHRLLLTIEVDSGETSNGSNIWNHQVFDFQDNVSSTNPAIAKVDWLKVSTRPKGDGLCN